MKFKIDRPYTSALLQIAIPIAIQNGINALLMMTDILMIGQLGSTSVAAAALANQVAFLLTFFMYGVTSGAVAFTAQFWGRQDIASIRKVLGICMALCLLVAVLFTMIAEFLPAAALSLYTEDRAVIELGARYLQIVGLSYLFSAVSFSYSSVLKGMGLVRIPMLVSLIALSLKAVFSYTLIFGAFGVPAQGVIGGAIGTLAARVVEFVLMLLIVYLRRTPIAAKLPELLTFNRKFVTSYLKIALPVVVNEMIWSLGISVYNGIYAHISTEAIAAFNIATSIEALAYVLLIANSDAGGILTGNQIGAGNDEMAYTVCAPHARPGNPAWDRGGRRHPGDLRFLSRSLPGQRAGAQRCPRHYADHGTFLLGARLQHDPDRGGHAQRRGYPLQRPDRYWHGLAGRYPPGPAGRVRTPGPGLDRLPAGDGG